MQRSDYWSVSRQDLRGIREVDKRKLIERLWDYDNCTDGDIDLAADVLEQAHDIIEQLASAPAELDDERLSYMTIQVDRDLIERAKKWLEGGE